MKKILLSILLCFGLSHGMTYFGTTDTSGGNNNESGQTKYNDNSGVVYTCPGSGNMTVNELGGNLLKGTSDSAGVRMAIYTTTGKLVMQGADSITVKYNSNIYAWFSHTSFKDSNGNVLATPTLTGGTNYVFAGTAGGVNLLWRKVAVTSGYAKYNGTKYLTGFPATLSLSGSNSGSLPVIRCGVTPSCTPSTITRHATIIDTVDNGVHKYGHVTTGSADSFAIIGTPSLDSIALLSKTKDTIVYKPKVAGSKVAVTVRSYSCASYADAIDTLQYIYGQIYVDSCRPASGYYGDTVTIYGRAFGTSKGSSTVLFGDSTPTVVSWANTKIKMIAPNIDTGYVDFIVSDGSSADTLTSGFQVLKKGPLVLDSIQGNNLISTVTYKRVYRGDTLKFFCTNLPDTTSSCRVFLNSLNCTIWKWSNGKVFARTPTSAPSGYYRTPALKTIIGTDTTTTATSQTPFRVMVFGK